MENLTKEELNLFSLLNPSSGKDCLFYLDLIDKKTDEYQDLLIALKNRGYILRFLVCESICFSPVFLSPSGMTLYNLIKK